jgi:hypothetical protein
MSRLSSSSCASSRLKLVLEKTKRFMAARFVALRQV